MTPRPQPLWIIVAITILLGGLFSVPVRAEEEPSYPTLTLWPLAYHRAGAESSSTDILWPFIHHERQQTRTLFKIRPFLFSSEADNARDYRRADVLWPLSRFESEGPERWNHLFPVLWSGENARRRWFHLWPIYGEEEKADGMHGHFTLYPLFGYSNNPQTGDWAADYLWPLGHAYRQGATSGGRLLPLWWQRRSPDSGGGLVFPFFWYDTPQHSTRGIFPLWYRQVGPNARFNLLLPLYLDKGNADSRLRAFFPGFFSYRSESATTTGLVPLWLHRKSDTSRFTVLLPFYLNHADTEGSTTLLLPFWFGSRGEGWSFRTLFPVYWQSHTPASDLRLVVPLHLRSSDERDETELWPLYFRHRDREAGSELRYYFPLYGRYTLRDSVTRHYLLFPLYAHFVDRERDWQSWNVLWPLLHLETAPSSYETWLLPFFWMARTPQESSTMALGLYWSRQRELDGWSLLLPLWWSSRSAQGHTRVLFPLYAERGRSDGWRKRYFLGPLAIAENDPGAGRAQFDLLWPLVSHESGPQREHTRILPFYWHTATAEHELTLGSAALLPPYYLYSAAGDERVHHLWPFFGSYRSGDYQEYSSLWPLLRWGSNESGTRRTQQLLLYYNFTNDGAHTSGLFPVLHHDSDALGSNWISLLHWSRADTRGRQFSLLHLGDPDWSLFSAKREGARQHQHLFPLYSVNSDPLADKRSVAILGPLYLYRRQGEATSSHHFLWKVAYSERAPDRHEAGLFWRLVRSLDDGNRKLFEANPFYYREQRSGEEFVSWLGGLFSRYTRAGEQENRLFWVIRLGARVSEAPRDEAGQK